MLLCEQVTVNNSVYVCQKNEINYGGLLSVKENSLAVGDIS